MRRKQDPRPRGVKTPGHLAERAYPDSAGLPAGAANQEALKGGPVQPQHRSGWLEQTGPGPDSAPETAAPGAGGEPPPGILVQAPRRRPRAWLLSALAVTLAVGGVLGFAMGSARSGSDPTSTSATRAPATPPAQATRTSVVVVARPTASSACLETARRGDQLIGLLVSKQRSRAADLLVGYTVASRQCRKDASP
jgi:hypothetical protein